MKNTWEEKARTSEQYERDRQLLENEQRDAAERLAKQMEEKWALLEEKNDIDLSVSHMKEILKQSSGDAISRVSQWQQKFKEIVKLESDLHEQYTVASVYKASLLTDAKSLVKKASQQESVS
jgi:transcription initiation factor IIF auxiliary subunit